MSDDTTSYSFGLIEYEPGDDAQDVVLTVEADPGGFFAYVEGSSGLIWKDRVAPEFFGSKTRVGEAGNDIRADVVADDATAAKVKRNFKQACRDLEELVEESLAEFRDDDADRVLDMTEKVTKFQARDGKITVRLATETDTAVVEFDGAEWLHGEPTGKVEVAVWDQLGLKVDLPGAAWQDLVDAWEDDMEVMRETHTGEDQVVQEVVGDVARLGIPVADKAEWGNSKHTMWYQEDVEKFGGEDVLWVRSKAVTAYLDDTSKSENWLPQLSRRLKEQGFTYEGSKRERIDGALESVYPFCPDEVGTGRDDLPDEDGGPEVEP